MRCSACAIIVMAATVVLAQPQFIRDINTTPWPGGGITMRTGVKVGSIYYFAANSTASGEELWRTDGTAAGTYLVKDIQPATTTSTGSSSPEDFFSWGNRLAFTAVDSVGRELWVTDGTAAGTVRLTDMTPSSSVTRPHSFCVLGSYLYFLATLLDGRQPLYRTDGTLAGTAIVYDPGGPAGSFFSLSGPHQGKLYMAGQTQSGGIEPWISDGTAAGTYQLADIHPSNFSPSIDGSTKFFEFGNHVYFSATNPTYGYELWRSDGTTAGTHLFIDINPGSASGGGVSLRPLGSSFVFIAQTAAAGYELWVSNGTQAGTQLIKDIYPGANTSDPEFLADLGAFHLFSALDGTTGRELWRTDGTAPGTYRVLDIKPGPTDGVLEISPSWTVFNAALYFEADDGTNGRELWKSDGTAAGTFMLRNIRTNLDGHAYPKNIVATTIGVFFNATGNNTGEELYFSDGTTAGTNLVVDLNPAAGSNPSRLFGFDYRCIFAAVTASSPRGPWISDSTAAGTQLLKATTPATQNTSATGSFREFGSGILMELDSGAELTGSELWYSDGTALGTAVVKDIIPGLANSSSPSELTTFAGQVFFAATETFYGRELWKSDGTFAGTVRVHDIWPMGSSSAPASLTTFANRLYFVANNGTHGRELWSTDGTGPGTQMLLDINTGPADGLAGELCAVGNLLFFSAITSTAGVELWATDGTVAGTAMVADIRPGAAGSAPQSLRAAGGKLFFTADNGTAGRELWVSDGTAAGTTLLADLVQGAGSPDIQWLTAAGNRVFFAATVSPTDRELYVSDGTPAGTFMVRDINPTFGSFPEHLCALGNNIVFSAFDGVHGTEPWFSDGTVAGTYMLKDVLLDGYSYPASFVRGGSKVYFVASGTSVGREIYETDGTPAGTILRYDVFPGEDGSQPVTLMPTVDRLYFIAFHPDYGHELWFAPYQYPPVVTLAPGTRNWTGGTAPLKIDAAAVVSDVDSANFDGGTLTVTLTSGGLATDILSIENQGTGAGQVGVAGANITFGGVPIGVASGGQGATPLEVQLNASGSSLAAQALLRVVLFANSSPLVPSGVRQVEVGLRDGDLGISHPVSITINVSAAVYQLDVITQPGNSVVGASLAPQPVVALKDSAGQVITEFTGDITTAISAGPAGAILGGTAALPAVDGVANFGNLSINMIGSGYALTFTTPGHLPAQSAPFDIVVGAASTIALLVQPGGASGGTAFAAQPQVRIVDSLGNTIVSDNSTPVTAGIVPGTGTAGATLAGAKTVVAVAGVATFANLGIDFAGAAYRLEFFAPGLQSAQSVPFNVAIGPAAQITIFTQPSSGTGGTTLPVQPVIQIRDEGGNIVVSDNTTQVTAGISTGTGTPGASLSGGTATAFAGVAIFGNIAVNVAGTGYTLAFSSPGLQGVVSAPFDVAVGPAAAVTISVQPGSGIAAGVLAPQPVLQLVDAGGNAVLADSVTQVTATIMPGTGTAGATIIGASTATASAGVVSFTGLGIDLPGSSYRLAFESGTLTGANSAPFDVSTPPPAVDDSGSDSAGCALAAQNCGVLLVVLGILAAPALGGFDQRRKSSGATRQR